MYDKIFQAFLIILLIYFNAFMLLSTVLYINFVYKKIKLDIEQNKINKNSTKK